MEDPGGHRFALSIVFYVAAYVVGTVAFVIMARRRRIATDGITILACAGLLGGAFGAQLVQSIAGGIPGKSLLGGVAVGYLAVLYAKRQLGIKRPTGDLFAVALSAGEAVGRIGCFFAGCCYGKVTSLPWGVYDHGAFRHPTQLYSGLAAALTLALLVFLERRRILPENGLFYVQIAVLCALRFPIEFVRDVPATMLGLTTVQVACVVAFTFFAWRLARLLANPQRARHAVRVAT
jgi:phosphatidylglycerol---prolipoprotein diacylglyceryl transferase